MKRWKDPKGWARGLIAGAITGGAGAGANWLGMLGAEKFGIKVPEMNINALWIMMLIGTLSHTFAYLKQSPLPELEEVGTKMLNAILLGVMLSLGAGCASFVSEQTSPDGTTTTIRAITFMDGRSDLAKLRTTQTEKTQGVSLGALGQETSGTNVTSIIEAIVRAAVSAAAIK